MDNLTDIINGRGGGTAPPRARVCAHPAWTSVPEHPTQGFPGRARVRTQRCIASLISLCNSPFSYSSAMMSLPPISRPLM